MRLIPSIVVLGSLIFPLAYPSWASDSAKEQRWADQIVDALIDGDAEWLQASGQKFLSIYTDVDAGTPKYGAIVLHGIGVHPSWDQVVYPLRTGLVEYGMPTLSLQLPILPNDAEQEEYIPLIPEAGPRIAAGISFLKKRGVQRVVIVAHSLGSTMAAHYLATNPDQVAGFVAIGMQVRGRDPESDVAAMLRKISIPLLDLYGSDDLPGVLETASAKSTAAAGNKHYTQLRIAGADHFFDEHDEILVTTVADWISGL